MPMNLKKLYKQKVKKHHDKKILNKSLKPGHMVLLFNSRLKLFSGRLKSKWSRTFQIKEVKHYREIMLENPVSKENWTINGQRLNIYLGGEIDRLTTTIPFSNPLSHQEPSS